MDQHGRVLISSGVRERLNIHPGDTALETHTSPPKIISLRTMITPKIA